MFDLSLRLPGQYFDKETNNHHNYFRDYDPSLGIYKQSDLIGLRGGLNTYNYVDNNPISFTDAEGLKPLPVRPRLHVTWCAIRAQAVIAPKLIEQP